MPFGGKNLPMADYFFKCVAGERIARAMPRTNFAMPDPLGSVHGYGQNAMGVRFRELLVRADVPSDAIDMLHPHLLVHARPGGHTYELVDHPFVHTDPSNLHLLPVEAQLGTSVQFDLGRTPSTSFARGHWMFSVTCARNPTNVGGAVAVFHQLGPRNGFPVNAKYLPPSECFGLQRRSVSVHGVDKVFFVDSQTPEVRKAHAFLFEGAVVFDVTGHNEASTLTKYFIVDIVTSDCDYDGSFRQSVVARGSWDLSESMIFHNAMSVVMQDLDLFSHDSDLSESESEDGAVEQQDQAELDMAEADAAAQAAAVAAVIWAVAGGQ
ncbi:hypothetical protein T492DRAFT_832765 [Pavlovales sp. CCMP2436]|nr:hypothetical protein T492DRAFT_832765 [Pavlovales sp. CCMP2436]